MQKKEQTVVGYEYGMGCDGAGIEKRRDERGRDGKKGR